MAQFPLSEIDRPNASGSALRLAEARYRLLLDSAVEAHMLDLLVYRESGSVAPNAGPHRYQIAGKSCLAGDVFGEFDFPEPLAVGDRISLLNAGGYTMVKKNWFNGVAMPAIAIRRKTGAIDLVQSFDYADYVASLS